MKIIFGMQEITKAILYRVMIAKFVAHEEAKIITREEEDQAKRHRDIWQRRTDIRGIGE
jgi:hypothetical protein